MCFGHGADQCITTAKNGIRVDIRAKFTRNVAFGRDAKAQRPERLIQRYVKSDLAKEFDRRVLDRRRLAAADPFGIAGQLGVEKLGQGLPARNLIAVVAGEEGEVGSGQFAGKRHRCRKAAQQ